MFVLAIGLYAETGRHTAKEGVGKQLNDFAYGKFHGQVQEKFKRDDVMLKRAFDISPTEPWRRFAGDERPLFVHEDEGQRAGCAIRHLILQGGSGKPFLSFRNSYGGSR